MENNRQSSTVRSYISAIKAVLQEDGVIIDQDNYLLTSLTKACKYKNDQVRIRLPITKGMLNILLDELTDHFDSKGQVYLKMLYRAMLAVGYYGLLRVGEMASGEHLVKAVDAHVADNKRKIMFKLQTSKTHWTDKKPQEIKISSTENMASDQYCPYQILREYMKARPKCTNASEPLFLFVDKSPIHPDQLRRILKQMLKYAGFSEELYNVHSLRIGRSSDLYHKCHISILDLKKIGRWHSNSVFTYLS